MSFQGKKSIPKITVRPAPAPLSPGTLPTARQSLPSGPQKGPPVPRQSPALWIQPPSMPLSRRWPFPRLRRLGVPVSAAPSPRTDPGAQAPGPPGFPGPL